MHIKDKILAIIQVLNMLIDNATLSKATRLTAQGQLGHHLTLLHKVKVVLVMHRHAKLPTLM